MFKKAVYIVILYVCFSGSLLAAIVDLTTSGASGFVNDAFFFQIDPDVSAGTGVFDSFVRIQGNTIEEGYNTDGNPEFQTKTGAWTHALQIADVPAVTMGYNGIKYREFALDINQNSAADFSLDALKVYLEPVGNLTGYADGFNNLIYDMDAAGDNWVVMNYSLNAGSGKGDVIVYIPDALFAGTNEYVYLYSRFGEHGAANDGFEEWGVGAGGAVTPEPATLLLLGLGGAMLRKRRA